MQSYTAEGTSSYKQLTQQVLTSVKRKGTNIDSNEVFYMKYVFLKIFVIVSITFLFYCNAYSQGKNGLEFSVRDNPELIKKFDFERLIQNSDTTEYVEVLRRICDVDAVNLKDNRIISKYYIPILTRIIAYLVENISALSTLSNGKEVIYNFRYDIAYDFYNIPQTNRQLFSLVNLGKYILRYIDESSHQWDVSENLIGYEKKFFIKLLLEDILFGESQESCISNYLHPFYNNRPAISESIIKNSLEYAGFKDKDVTKISFFELKEAIDRRLLNDISNGNEDLQYSITDIVLFIVAVVSNSDVDYLFPYLSYVQSLHPSYYNEILIRNKLYEDSATSNFWTKFQRGFESAFRLDGARTINIDKEYNIYKSDFLELHKKYKVFPSFLDLNEKESECEIKEYYDLYLKISYYILKNFKNVLLFDDKSTLGKYIGAEPIRLGYENFNSFVFDAMYSSCQYWWQYRDNFALDVLELCVSISEKENSVELEGTLMAVQIYLIASMKNRATQILSNIGLGHWIDVMTSQMTEDELFYTLNLLISYMQCAAECEMDAIDGKSMELYEQFFDEKYSKIRTRKNKEELILNFLSYKYFKKEYADVLSRAEIIYDSLSDEGKNYLDLIKFDCLFSWEKFNELCDYAPALLTDDIRLKDSDYYLSLAIAYSYSNDPKLRECIDSLSKSIRTQINSRFLIINESDREDIYQKLQRNLSALFITCKENKDEQIISIISSFLYNWILVSKGLLLETNKLLEEKFRLNSDSDVQDVYQALKSISPIINDMVLKNRSKDERLMIMGAADVMSHSLQEYLKVYNANDDYSMHLFYDWQEIQARLCEHDIAIEFVKVHPDYSEGFYMALLLTPNSEYPVMIELCDENEIHQTIGALSGNRIYSNAYVSRKLYNLIWQPLESYLIGVENVYFSVDGILHHMNIEALTMNEGCLLCDSLNLNRLSSTRELLKINRSDVFRATLYGGLNYNIGNEELILDEYDSRGSISEGIVPINSLSSETLPEIQFIREQLIPIGVVVDTLIGNNGKEETFKKLTGSKVNLIHMATHGFFFDGITEYQTDKNNILPPMLRSGLEMSRSQTTMPGEEDGLLLAAEIADLDLRNVSLFVMSACETGKGSIQSDGVFGLQRGLKQAGVGSIIMTLWKVDSQITQIFMQEFYRAYVESRDAHQSFKKARSKAKAADPRSDWSAFIMLD